MSMISTLEKLGSGGHVEGALASTRHPLSRLLPKTPKGPMRSPARALGWFSIGLGLAELIMPRALARAAGSPNLPRVTRAYGLREIGVGVGLLTSEDPAPWLWARVAGDALDVVTVAPGLVTSGRPMRTMLTLATLCGVAWIDLKTAQGAVPKPGSDGESLYGYGDRSGFARPVSEMRGAARRPLRQAMPPAVTATSSNGSAPLMNSAVPARPLMASAGVDVAARVGQA